VVRSGTVYERGGNSTVISCHLSAKKHGASSVAGPGTLVISAGEGFGVASAEESVLGGEDRSTLGPASDIRGRIRVSLVQSQDGGKVGRRLDRCHRMTEDVTRLNQERAAVVG
jgi:hypothetical protein